MSEQWDGRPPNPEQDSEGHVWRVDGCMEVYKWVAKNQWYEDRKGRWFVPEDALNDGDIYFGRIVTPAEVAVQIEAARREEREAIAHDLDCGCPDETKAAVLEALRGGFNSAKRWKACSYPQCSAIEAATIRARGDA